MRALLLTRDGPSDLGGVVLRLFADRVKILALPPFIGVVIRSPKLVSFGSSASTLLISSLTVSSSSNNETTEPLGLTWPLAFTGSGIVVPRAVSLFYADISCVNYLRQL